MEFIIPVQIGLTAFFCDPKTGNYLGTIYNFYLVPSSFATIQKPFYFQPETLIFLKHYEFDFNKVCKDHRDLLIYKNIYFSVCLLRYSFYE